MKKIQRSFIAFIALALLLTPAVASARDGESGSGSGSSHISEAEETQSPSPSSIPSTDSRQRRAETELRDQLEQQKAEREASIQKIRDENKAELKEKLDDAKKKACENHQATINKLMDGMDKRRQNAFDRITQVSEKAQAFYLKKELSVTNYADLVAAVNAAKSAAQTAMQSQLAIPELKCDGDHPRADVTDFKEKRADSIDAMKAYRDAVKTLVKAIKSAAEAKETQS